MKSVTKLVVPLRPQCGRSHHERTQRGIPAPHLGDDEARLDRLSKSDVVGEEQSTRLAAKQCEQRLELVRKDLHSRANGRRACMPPLITGEHACKAGDDVSRPRPAY